MIVPIMNPRTAKRRTQAEISHFQYIQVVAKQVFENIRGIGEEVGVTDDMGVLGRPSQSSWEILAFDPAVLKLVLDRLGDRRPIVGDVDAAFARQWSGTSVASICCISLSLESGLGVLNGREIDEVDTGIARAILRTSATNLQYFRGKVSGLASVLACGGYELECDDYTEQRRIDLELA